MTRRYAGAILAAVAMMVSGCTGGAGLSHGIARNPNNFAQPDAPAPVAVSNEYRIGIADELRVIMFQVPDLTENVTVDSTGKTPRQVQDELQGLYGKTYIQSPQVTVSVEKSVNQRITVDGAVSQPGVYAIAGNTTLLQAVALAHGAGGHAILSRVVIFRRINGPRPAAAFDLRQIRSGSMADPSVYGDDVVVVDGSSIRSNLHEALSAIPVLAIFGVF